MATCNPYLADEMVMQDSARQSLFGLIGSDQAHQTELSGFEITTTGEIVEPLLALPSNTLPCNAVSLFELE